MNTIQRKLVERAIEYLDDVEIRDDYSGRGMYGKTCFGITGTILDYGKFVANLIYEADVDPDEFPNGGDDAMLMVDSLCYDSMRKNFIFYFPGWQLTD